MSQKTYIAAKCRLRRRSGRRSRRLPQLSQPGARRGRRATPIVCSPALDGVLKKVMEEAGETALAAKDVESWACSSLAASIAASGAVDETDELAVDLPPEYDAAIDHLRYEAADVVYHLLVVLERYGIGLDEFAAELNNRMTDGTPRGRRPLHEDHVKRGKRRSSGGYPPPESPCFC